MAEGTGASTEHSLLSDHQLARRVVPLSICSDMLGSGASPRPQDPDDRTRSGPCTHSYHHQAPAVPKPGSPAPAPLEPLPFGFRTPPPLPARGLPCPSPARPSFALPPSLPAKPVPLDPPFQVPLEGSSSVQLVRTSCQSGPPPKRPRQRTRR